VRGKPTFWARPHEHVIEFLHLHLFTFAPAFRFHAGIRVLHDASKFVALNGPCSDASYHLDFEDTQDSVEFCAQELARYFSETAEPWFARYRDKAALLAADSPLDEGARTGLKLSLNDLMSREMAQASRDVMGIV
jgi:hypothetical protein